MDGISRRAKRKWLIRWWIGQALAVYFGFPLFLLVVFEGRVEEYGRVVADDEYFWWMAGTLAVVSLLQALYLRPVREPAPSGRPTSLFWSMSVAGLAAAFLLTGVAAGLLGVAHDLAGVLPSDDGAAAWGVLGLFALSWVVGTPLLASFVDRSSRPEEPLKRISAAIFTGTVVEVLAAIPLDRLARRKADCVCARGTFWSIVFGVAGGLVLVGPLVFLLLLARRHRRWPLGRCAACQADVGENLRVPRCPSCGAGWAG